MVRRMSEKIKELLRRHDEHRNYIMNHKEWSDEQKAFFLSGRNCAVEDMLHAHKCYHGYKHVDANGNGLSPDMFKDEHGQPKSLSALLEQSRHYYES